MAKDIDCIVCGSCVVDMLVRPVSLDQPLAKGRLFQVEPIEVTTGGIVSNAGIAMARLGMQVAAFSYVGRDDWGALIRRRYQEAGIETSGLLTHPTGATSTTAVLIDPSGERSFAHCVGAPRELNGQVFLDHLSLFARSRMVLIGYYSLMPNLEIDLAAVLAEIQKTGCRTALDAAGEGGDLQPLDRLLPHLDVYVPSLAEATHQTGESDPERVLRVYRSCGARGLLGVKLGADGALLSPQPNELVRIPSVTPPGDVVDTTGAGDCFYAGLVTGLLREMSVEQAGQLAAATGACCVTGLGATSGLRDYETTATLAGITNETP